jgi:hypothetical protein
MSSREAVTPARLSSREDRSLSPEHRRELHEGSGISQEVRERRGYRTVTAAEALEVGFSEDQARDGLLIPFYSPAGEVSYQLKPYELRVIRGKAVKYETRAGHDIVLDVHPRNHGRLLYSGEDLYVVEGIKKADCLTSLGRLVIGLSGVWNWGRKRKRGGAKYGRPELLPDWDVVPLEGRKVYILFDADYREKQNVALAILRLAERLTERGAHVYIINLPGPEKGIDDYVVTGGDVETLENEARPFTASNLIRYAAKRDERVWGVVAGIVAAMRTDDWTERGAATTYSLLRALLELALLGGRYDQGTETVEIMIGTRELRHYAAIGSPSTLSGHTAKLGERGYIEKVTGDRAKGRANRYVLKFSKGVPLIERGQDFGRDSIPGTVLENFTPHLRWPSPARTSIKGDEADSKLPDEGATPENLPHEKPDIPRIYVEGAAVPEHPELEVSLGKVVEMAIHLLVSWGGCGSLRDLSTATGVGDTSKLRAKLEGVAGVVGMDSKGKHGARVWLEEGWERRLDEHRERTGELRRARQQAVRHRKARVAFRNDEPADEQTSPLIGKERTAEILEEQRPNWERARVEEQRQKAGTTAEVFLADQLEGITAVRWQDLRALWIRSGGNGEVLRQAVFSGPYRFQRESTDEHLYIYHASARQEAVAPERVEPAAAPRRERTADPREALTAEEIEDLEAIYRYESQGYTFEWTRADWKGLFYKLGRWPDEESLRRLREAYEAEKELVAA